MSALNTFDRHLALCLFGLVLLVGSSCGPDQKTAKEKKDLAELVFEPSLTGMFRGMALGETYADVKAKACNDAITDVDESLECHYIIPWNESNNKLVAYYAFDSFGLFEIQADLFLMDRSMTDRAFEEFSKYFEARYGAPTCSGQMCQWTTFSKANNVVEVTLSKEAFEKDQSFLSINFLEPLNDEV